MKMRPFLLVVLDPTDEKDGAGVIMSKDPSFPLNEKTALSVPHEDQMEVSVQILVQRYRHLNDPETGGKFFTLFVKKGEIWVGIAKVGQVVTYENFDEEALWTVPLYDLVKLWLRDHPDTPPEEREEGIMQ